MAGGLLELVARGVQDIYLIGDPQITFFKVVYKRHTNFSIESIRAVFDGNADFGQKITAKLPRNGDLMHRMVLEVDLPAISRSGSLAPNVSYVNSAGHALIDYIELRIGGNLIDKHYGEWLEIWNQLTRPEEHVFAYQDMLSKYNSFTSVRSATTVYIPLQFWFCRNIGLALPLISLQYHEVELSVKIHPFSRVHTFGPFNYYTASQTGDTITKTSGQSFTDDATDANANRRAYWADGTVTDLGGGTVSSTQITGVESQTVSSQEMYIGTVNTVSGTPQISDMRLYVDYIFLDTYERKKFAQMKHKYLIEQLQYNGEVGYGASASDKKFDLDFNLPVKSIYWVSQLDRFNRDNDVFNFSDTFDPNTTKIDPVSKAVLYINGTERFEERNGKVFRIVNPLHAHTNVPNDFIYMYSFALKPESHQPTGSMNFSKIDNANLKITFKSALPAGKIRIYGLSYNILRIESGMGGLAFAN